MANQKYRWLKGKLNTVENNQPKLYRPGDIFEAEPQTMANFLAGGNCEIYVEKVQAGTEITEMAFLRPDGLFDLVNPISQVAVADRPLTEAEAAGRTQAFSRDPGWIGLDYGDADDGQAPFYIIKFDGIRIGKPMFAVIDRATKNQTQEHLLTKAQAEEELEAKLAAIEAPPADPGADGN